ncbi:MAG TPA: hypothetical protein VGC39_10595, partial [Candidatus Methylacidiphilales bacterium]
MSPLPASEFGPERLSTDWLRNQENSGDPWILEATNSDDPGHRDAFIGNGFLGQRFNTRGEASCLMSGDNPVPGGCLVHGLWGDISLMPAPQWATLSFNDGTAEFAPGIGQWENYRQRLDLRTGTLATELTWRNGPRQTRISTMAYVSRARPQVCLLSRTLVPNYSGTVSVTDSLDGAFIDDARDWRFTNGKTSGAPLSIQLRMGPRDRQVAVLSRLSLEGIEAETLEPTQTEKSVRRKISFPVAAGSAYTVTKSVARVTDA